MSSPPRSSTPARTFGERTVPFNADSRLLTFEDPEPEKGWPRWISGGASPCLSSFYLATHLAEGERDAGLASYLAALDS